MRRVYFISFLKITFSSITQKLLRYKLYLLYYTLYKSGVNTPGLCI